MRVMSMLPTLGPRGEGWVAIQAVLLAAIGLAGFALPGGWTGPSATGAAVVGALLIGVGGVVVLLGIGELQRGDAMTPLPHPRDDGRLVESGVYRLVRHPVYGGLVVGAVGWALLRGSVPALVAAGALLVFFDLKRRREEAWLTARFPGYAVYRARTRRMIPWLY
jgi:protein-S-isoprenylcysteine O-methyltransferase Ste14